MRKPLLLALCIVLTHQAVALAQPAPATSVCLLGGQSLPCQYRFRADGGLDQLSVGVLINDAAGAHVVGWPVTCTLVPNAGTLTFCTCCPNPQAAVTNALGIVVFTWSKIGGRGTLDVAVSAVGSPVAWLLPITFTSPDLSGSCDLAPLSATTIIDLGIWAGALPPAPYNIASDYDCSGAIGVVDLGLFAGGLAKGCGPPCP